MCGIAGVIQLDGAPIPRLQQRLNLMNRLIAHRGPDGAATWLDPSGCAGFAHRRLSIIDLTATGTQPMVGADGAVLTFNGEIYNYRELRSELGGGWPFRSTSDSETILAAHARHGDAAVERLRGMWAYSLWSPDRRRLFASRDRFGIKPFYYATVGRTLYFASEIKALLPFLAEVRTSAEALAEYVTFQFGLGPETLFEGVRQLEPAHALVVENGRVTERRYWDVTYAPDPSLNAQSAQSKVRALLEDSVDLHLRSDVPVGAYVSGGVDSSLIALLAARRPEAANVFFHGKFSEDPACDESRYARDVATRAGGELFEVDITATDFERTVSDIIWHLDQPVAGPGAFPQYMVSGLAAQHVKVVLGGQGGDEIFGGYARFMIAYLDQCLRVATEGGDERLDPSFQSLIPQLGLLREYRPMAQGLFAQGMFGPLEQRYFRLIDRSADMSAEVDWGALPKERVWERFLTRFNRPGASTDAYLDRMTRFDFTYLLPALLQVEDRMSMAHGLEARVPLLDHTLVEFAATIPSGLKFEAGRLKHVLKSAFADTIPPAIADRRDKMGFPVPLNAWLKGDLGDFVRDVFSSTRARQREYMNPDAVMESVTGSAGFSRKSWGLLSLELWHQRFHDSAPSEHAAERTLAGVG